MIKINDIKIEKTSFRGKDYVAVRKYYISKEGKELPSKSGINFSIDEWNMFVNKFEEIVEDVK